jgi:hypothetical protein
LASVDVQINEALRNGDADALRTFLVDLTVIVSELRAFLDSTAFKISNVAGILPETLSSENSRIQNILPDSTHIFPDGKLRRGRRPRFRFRRADLFSSRL